MELFGTIRITNLNTLERWKRSGKYQRLVDEGYIFANGCGRFRTEICNCHKCRYYNTKQNKL